MRNFKKVVIIILVSMPGVFAYGQGVLIAFPGFTTALQNTDVASTGVLTLTAGATATRVLEIGAITGLVKQSQITLDKVVKEKYKKTKYDKQSGFIAAAKTATMSLGAHIMGKEFSNGYYMTKNKRDYMTEIGLDKAPLATIQFLDYKNLTSEDRQEIYRLRNEIAKEYSLNDREVRKLLLLPAVKYSAEVAPELAQLVNSLEFIE